MTETTHSICLPPLEAPPIDTLLKTVRLTGSTEDILHTKGLMTQLANEVLGGELILSDSLITSLDHRIAAIDELLSSQINEVLHHPSFQALEATWRGLQYLTQKSETGPLLQIKVFNAKKKDIVRDLRTCPEFDQSALFRQVYEQEYGSFGGNPFTTLVVDYEFSKSTEDMYLLDQLAHIGAAAHAPVISAASPELFGLESFADIANPRDLSRVFDTSDYIKWRSLRNNEDARYVGLVLPHVLGRLPYNPDHHSAEQFCFVESFAECAHQSYLWMNAAYAYAANLADAFCRRWGLGQRFTRSSFSKR